MEAAYFRKIFSGAIILVLVILSFFVLKPILLYIILGFIIAFIFSPLYSLVYKWTKAPNFSATLIVILLVLLIILPVWFFTPLIIDQAFKIYLTVQQTDFVSLLKDVFPSLFASEQFSTEVGSTIHSFTTNTINSFLNVFSDFILNFPSLLLNSLVVIFTLFFALRDKDKLIAYIKGISPFSKDIENKFFRYSKEITASVLYGQVVLGFVQGIVLLLGFLILGIPNYLLLGVLGIIAGILPIIGPMLIWIPVAGYMLIQGNVVGFVGVLIVGIISSNIDNLLRPVFISKMTKLPSSIVLIGMIGGLFLFGILGLILGPLILAYLLIILEVYRDKHSKGTFYTALIKTD